MSQDRQVDLSVIIVNFNVAPLVLEAVASLQRQKFAAEDGGDGRLEILVVDNASSPGDLACLERLPPSVALVRNDRNLGFAAANNRGLERAAGRHLCFLNPDTQVLDGALDLLLQHCYRHRQVGAVGPKIWGDDERTLRLPPADPPTLSFLLAQVLGRVLPPVGRWHSRRWRARALAFWRRRVPTPVPMLSGACILTPRAVVERVGRFDPGYFLYYEDADWCRRVRRAGYSLAYVPEAEIIHYYNQSAKADPGEAQRHAIESQERFVDAYYGWPGRSVLRAALGLGSRLARRWGAIPLPGLVDLGRIAEPPRLRVPHAPPHREAVIELAYDWLFVPSVAAFVGAADFRLSPSVWERMQPGRYYARLTDPQTLRPLALWSWEKG